MLRRLYNMLANLNDQVKEAIAFARAADANQLRAYLESIRETKNKLASLASQVIGLILVAEYGTPKGIVWGWSEAAGRIADHWGFPVSLRMITFDPGKEGEPSYLETGVGQRWDAVERIDMLPAQGSLVSAISQIGYSAIRPLPKQGIIVIAATAPLSPTDRHAIAELLGGMEREGYKYQVLAIATKDTALYERGIADLWLYASQAGVNFDHQANTVAHMIIDNNRLFPSLPIYYQAVLATQAAENLLSANPLAKPHE